MKIAPFKLERYFANYEFNTSFLLCTSDCESMSIGELLSLEKGSEDEFKNHWLGYTESQGNPVLKEEISRFYEKTSASEILVHSGAEEAIFTFMNAVLKYKDHIIVHYPCYQSLFEIAHSIGCEITKWEVKEENNWELDIGFLKENIKENTKAIIINCPHNPTGYLMSKEKLYEITNIAKHHNIFLFSDEVYRYLEYDEKDRIPAACDIYDNAVSLGVMSKTFGLPGLRIGWIATKNKESYNNMAAFKDYTTICNSAPSEFLSIIALKNKEKIIERNKAIVIRNLTLLDAFFERYSDFFTWVRPKAGSIGFPGIKTGVDIEKFCIDLVEKSGVLLLPGTYYDSNSRNFRIGFGRYNMPEALEHFHEYFKIQNNL
ncbi:capreomycidine synthase [Oxobacter pfennigii]|uniref:Capreomycidine synthase n=1 Tax=Oxobacter pfennigii TaxID=36849 RepID=A0A0P8W5V2_9CLOT|nr:aminotransferase class I/II-fold pyridoxal phosphate-dependent enzyme [Oxobacter pfennigii]KPU43071.1 capreomycidine synthase [Oxobacter pfennigii]